MTLSRSRLGLLLTLLAVPFSTACAEDAVPEDQASMVTPTSPSNASSDSNPTSTSTNGSSPPSNGDSSGGTPNAPASTSGTSPGMGGQGAAAAGGAGGSNGSQGGAGEQGAAGGQGGTRTQGGAPNQGGAGAPSRGGAASTGGDASTGGTQSTGGNGGEAQQAMGCNSASLLFCEDFEAAPLGGIPDGWTAEGDVEVTADGRTDQQALRSNAQPSWRRVIRHDASSFGPEHWGRIYYRVQMPVTAAFVHSTFAAFTGDGPNIGAAEYRVVDTVKSESDGSGNHTHQFLWNVQIEGGSEFGRGSDYDWSFDDQWHCAEWFISATTQAYRFFIDGEEVTQIQIENGPGNYGENSDSRTDIPMQFNDFWVGFTNYQEADPGFVAWVDDVAIGAARVGCN